MPLIEINHKTAKRIFICIIITLIFISTLHIIMMIGYESLKKKYGVKKVNTIEINFLDLYKRYISFTRDIIKKTEKNLDDNINIIKNTNNNKNIKVLNQRNIANIKKKEFKNMVKDKNKIIRDIRMNLKEENKIDYLDEKEESIISVDKIQIDYFDDEENISNELNEYTVSYLDEDSV